MFIARGATNSYTVRRDFSTARLNFVCTPEGRGVELENNYHSIKRWYQMKKLTAKRKTIFTNFFSPCEKWKFNNENYRFAADLTEEFILFHKLPSIGTGTREKLFSSGKKLFSNRLACEDVCCCLCLYYWKNIKKSVFLAHTFVHSMVFQAFNVLLNPQIAYLRRKKERKQKKNWISEISWFIWACENRSGTQSSKLMYSHTCKTSTSLHRQ